jgi:hypothetical protein
MVSVPLSITAIFLVMLPSLSLSETCSELSVNAKWTDQERWAWREICEGREANLQHYGGGNKSAELRAQDAREDLSQRFLETILLAEPFRSSIPGQSVRISWARFPDTINLSHSKLDGDLWLKSSRFDGSAEGESVNLAGAEIKGKLNLEGSSASANVNMDSLHAGEIQMNYVSFPSVWLATARVGSQISANDATVRGRFQMTNLEVGTDLHLINSTLEEVVLTSARVAGRLDIQGPRRQPDSAAQRLNCRNHTVPRKSHRPQSVDLAGATVGTLSFGSFCYGPIDAAANWGAGAELILTGASVHTLQDGLCRENEANCTVNTWPEHLKLIGFTYQELESFDYDRESDMLARPIAWWTSWLGRQGYSQQPYEYLAATFSKAGLKDKSEELLYAGKNRELENTPFPANIKLWLERVFIGYGYRIRYAVLWALGFIILGAVVLRISGEGARNRMPFGIAFSFDMLLPIVKLREYHYDVDLNGWARYYFYFHKLMGFVLASFLIAGLSGLTK